MMSILEDIACHVDMMSTEQMRRHAMTGPEGDHDLSFQIFRYLSGYDEALKEIDRMYIVLSNLAREFAQVAGYHYTKAEELLAEIDAGKHDDTGKDGK